MDVPPVAPLETLPPDAGTTRLAEVLLRDGAVIIEDLLSAEQVERIDVELQPHVEQRRPGFREHGHDDDFYGANTVRIQGLARKSPTIVNDLMCHPTVLDLVGTVLSPYCGDFWVSQMETIFIGPGNKAQPLHRDDLNWSPADRLGIDLQVSVLTSLGGYHPEVGSTNVIPRSHRDGWDAPFDLDRVGAVDMAAGSAFVYLGSAVHGGGANTTTDQWRRGIYIGYLCGWLTPEECVPLGIGHEFAASLPQRARELLGFANIRSRSDGDGAAAALELWQMDQTDLDEWGASFHHR
jgi:ectoine hydroxylase-related dioxygenase (phytanoyl-CoA dioxygenase family)